VQAGFDVSGDLSGAPVSTVVDVSRRPALRGWLHAGGALGMLVAAPFLFAHAPSPARAGWVACYVVGVEAMLVTSALFHRGRWSPARRRAWRRADHTTIFLAIAGTWLAMAGLTMHGTVRLVLLVVVGTATLVGVGVRQFALDAPKWANTLPYLVVGWAALAVLPQLYRGGGTTFFTLVLVGGLAYTLGAAAYGAKRPRLAPGVFGYHELFHALTLVGAGCHFAALWVALR
jgi:hemolysin III